MKLLAIETATEACSAALLCGEERHVKYRVAPREHAALILPMIDVLIADAGLARSSLDAIAFGRGPGSFTGVRLAASVTQGIAFALDLPVVPVSTLATLAQRAMREFDTPRVLAAIDARMSEVYWGAFTRDDEGLAVPLADECVAAPEDVVSPGGEHWFGAGTGWRTYAELLGTRFGESVTDTFGDCLPSAEDTLTLARPRVERGETVDALAAIPVYLRDKVAYKPGERPRSGG